MERIKQILDSVHGYVSIPQLYADKIIDTPQFQRLRRIEQTSCRALFPSARHDRFIHSIGVFHLGSLICKHLWNDIFTDNEKQDNHLIAIIVTYRLACLLHDVGHTPFSHTFEDFFDNNRNNLLNTLARCIPEDENFEQEFISQFTSRGELRFAAHELLSAIVAIKYYREIIVSQENEWEGKQQQGIPSLLVRMIVGCRYNNPQNSLEDAFIELIHSDIIDADGLDYVCRDVWASGYATSTVDVTRIINSIMLCQDNERYTVCYNCKALNEIKSVLQVKDFQNDFVFNHHTIVLEQKILHQAMQSAAMHHLRINPERYENLENIRTDALKQLCNINMFYSGGFVLPNGEIIKNPMDDDFIHLMKIVDDEYITQWFSRQFHWFPLWKRKEAFLADLTDELRKDLDEHAWIFSESCKKYIESKYLISAQEIWFSEIKQKNKLEKLNNAFIYSNNQVCKYSKLYDDNAESSKAQQPHLKFIFLPKSLENSRKQIQQDLLQEWKKHIRTSTSKCCLKKVISQIKKFCN